MTEEFRDWKSNSITRAVVSEFATRIKVLTEELVSGAGYNPIDDATRAGAIKAYLDIVNITFADIEESHGN